ncbi:MAG: hypothetical protein IJK15_04145 [Bacteroidaceae bacterium]|nr:hypothetical protein [Bacteroidaceae bacterium]
MFYKSDFVTWSSTQFTYTGTVPSPNITCNLPAGFQLANDFTMPVLDKNVGTYETTIPMTFSNGHQSFTADIPYKYTIAPLSLKARVKNATREYGEVNPEFQTEYSGFIIGEDESVLTSKGTYSTTAYANSDVGKYTVTQSGATAQNYTIEYEPGTLTVTKAPLTVTARSKTMTYGDRMPTLEVDYAGLKNNESKPAWITDPDIMTTGTSSSNVGTYPITIRGGEAKNYNVTYKQGTLTINKASLTATTQDATREYGDEDPEFEMAYSGLKNNESAPAWRVAPTIVTATSKSSPVGTYDITATGGDARNYQVQYVNTGKLTVTKAPLTAKARSYTKKQGEPNPVFAVDYEGFKNGETKLALTQEPVAVTSAQQNSRPGTYPITLSDGIAMNYDFTYVDGTLTILSSDNPQEETENVLTLSGLTANRGAQVTLPIGMTNKKSITGVQFDLYLPVGVTVAINSKGKLMVTTTSRMDGNYSITGSDMGDYVRIVGYSADSDPFTGTSGDILNVTLNIGDEVADGNYTVRLKDIVLSDVNNTEHHPADVGGFLTIKSYTLGDVDNSGAVNINDVVCIINHILNRTTGTFIEEAADVDGSGVININDVVSLINRFILHRNNAPKKVSAENVVTEAGKDWLYLDDFVITAGETKEIAVMMKNANEVKAVQGNIKLPEGISFVTKSNGRLDVANLNDRSEDFTLSCALQEDGSMTFAQYSADGFAYDGNEGGIFTFKIKADDYAPKGNYDIIMTDIVMSIDGVAFEAPNQTSQIEINSTFDPEHPEYTTIAAMKNAANAQKVSVIFKANDLLVTFVRDSYVYVYDGTDGLLLFGANSGITAGDKITADIKGQLYLYKGMTEIDVNAYENLTINSSNNAVVPQKVTIADVYYNNTKDYENELVQFEELYAQSEALSSRNIVFYDSNENDLIVRDKYNVLTNTTFSLEDTYTVTGFVGIYSDGITRTEIYPRTAEDVSNGDISEPYEFAGDGTYENPYTVADIQHKYATSNRTPVESDVWVKAYIVGYISGSSLSVSNVIFSADAPGGTDKDGNPLTVSVSNILVADKANTKSVAEVIPIGLVNYSTARTDLNLADNPTRLGQLVWLKGDILKYFGVTGLKNVQLYSDGETPIVTSINNVSAIDPEGAMIFDATGKRLSKLQRGVNIIHMSDGTVKKVLVK